MSKINDIRAPIAPVRVEFYWTWTGEIQPFTIEGVTYPYKHQADEEPPFATKGGRSSDTRYKVLTSALNSPLLFDAVDKEVAGHPKVITPEGIFIVDYLWRFGDGTEAKGSTVNHTYIVPNPLTRVSLVVTDSRGIRWSAAKSLNLVSAAEARIVTDRVIV